MLLFSYRKEIFINPFIALFVTELDATLRKVVRAHCHFYLVAGEYLDVVQTHLARDIGNNLDTILKLHTEHSIGQTLYDGSVLLYS